MPYDANTNWANEEKYLNGLISQGGGNAAWAQNQLRELNNARAQYGGGGNGYSAGGGGYAAGGGYTQKDVDDFWKNDKTDYSANMLNAQSSAEFDAWAQDRQHKAAAQGIDISGYAGAPSNAQLYEQWRNNNYNASNYDSYVHNGQTGQGYYGMDSEGHWGYYDDSALTRKSANGTWDQYASSDGGYVRVDNRGVPDMTIQDMSRAGQTVYIKTPQGQYKVEYNSNGYPVQATRDGLGYNQMYSGPMYAAKTDNDQGVTSREMLYDQYGVPYIGQGGLSWDQVNADENERRMHVTGYQQGTRDLYERLLAERENRPGIGPVAGMERLIGDPGGYAPNPGVGVTSPQSYGGGGGSFSGGSSGSSSVSGTPGGGGSVSGGTGYTGGSGYDLTEYIRQQQAAALEAELAGLKGAYDTSVNGYNDQLARLQPIYDAQRNRAAAQDAVSQRGFDERAAALGLSSGAQGQAAVSRAQALQSALAGIGEAEGNARSDVELQMRNLTAQYESAIAQARAEGNATLAQNLYNELVRVQNLQRSDAQRQQEYQLEMAKLGASYGDYSGLNALGVNTSAYEAELAAQREAAAAAQAAEANAYDPTFTVSQVTQAIKNGWVTDQVLRDYEYYYGAPYGGATGGYAGSVGAANTVGGSGSRSSSTGTPSTSTKKTGSGYNNGSLTSAQVRQLQGALGVAQDGYFGPASQAAAQRRYGTSDANAAWRAYQGGGTNTQSGITRVGFEPDEGILSWNGKRYSSAEALANAASNAGLSRVQLQEIARQIKALTGREVGLQPVEPDQYTK